MTPAGHPDDESLSAHLDDEGDAGIVGHVQGCRTCRERLDDLRTVTAAVGGPVGAPAAGVIDAAVAAALAEFDGRVEAGLPSAVRVGAAPGPADRSDAAVRPLGHAHRPGRLRPPLVWLASAAAAIALLAGLPLLLDRDQPDRFTALPGNEAVGRASDDTAGGLPGPASPDGAPDADRKAAGASLGEYSSLDTLVAAVAGAPPATGQTADSAPVEAVGAPAPAQPEVRAATIPGSCELAARAVGGSDLGPLVYEARLRWRDIPATALVFRRDQPGTAEAGRQLYVMAVSDCALLAERPF